MIAMPRYLQRPPIPISVTVIGAGGTGSMLLTHLARINHALKILDGRELFVVLIDPDTVSSANCGRQMFTEADIGRHKADCLIERVNRFYQTQWIAINEEASINKCSANIVITCTDTKKSRTKVKKLLKHNESNHQANNFFWIDCGNEQHIGQVIIGSKAHNWKPVTDYAGFKKIKAGNNVPSCSLAEALGKQDLFINSWVANTAGTWLWQALFNKQIDWKGAFFNIKDMTFRKIKA